MIKKKKTRENYLKKVRNCYFYIFFFEENNDDLYKYKNFLFGIIWLMRGKLFGISHLFSFTSFNLWEDCDLF
jgi:hypothetical protein